MVDLGNANPVESGERALSSGSRLALLIVEDAAPLAASLQRGLAEEGFDVEITTTATAALSRMAKQDLVAVVLDLGLPDLDGREVIVRARAAGWSVPILVLTARDALASRVGALENGADDYLLKPFAFEELLARIRALLRRAAAPRWAPLAFGDVVLDVATSSFRAGERSVVLSPRERALLELLLRRRSETLSNQEILREAFGYHYDPGTNIVAVHVGHLRRKLEGTSVNLSTVRGTGYRLDLIERNE